ncbi:MAG: prepilin peptidase [Deltaproteobacteria bacterium]|nr:prepilin peptidase [Deltaproteobacteria bacterium]
MQYLSGLFIFVFGLCIGSFMNVCILPLKKSIVWPGSSCPSCGEPIRFYDNIPFFSYLWLRGRCRHCSSIIPARYMVVEVMGGAFALLAYLKFGLTLDALIHYAFVVSLLIITYIDLDYQIIPDRITLAGIPIGFLLSIPLPQITYGESILGILLGGGSLYLVAWLYYALKKREGMGGGDIKLLAMIGAFLGWKAVLFTIFIASAVGTISGLLVMIQKQDGLKTAIPFGPFLSIGAICYIFLGQKLIAWYIGLLR